MLWSYVPDQTKRVSFALQVQIISSAINNFTVRPSKLNFVSNCLLVKNCVVCIEIVKLIIRATHVRTFYNDKIFPGRAETVAGILDIADC